ncbi:MAG: hypothetical protein VW226_10390 [Rhodospirillaceae bacterium]
MGRERQHFLFGDNVWVAIQFKESVDQAATLCLSTQSTSVVDVLELKDEFSAGLTIDGIQPLVLAALSILIAHGEIAIGSEILLNFEIVC